MTLAVFLLARIAEDEDTANRADTGGPWTAVPLGVTGNSRSGYMVAEAVESDQADHIALHDPARVLAECESKRRIVARCSAVDFAMPSTHLAHGILSEMALPYADHPDYRDEWKP